MEIEVSFYTLLCVESLKAMKLRSNEPFRWFLLKLRLQYYAAWFLVIVCWILSDQNNNLKNRALKEKVKNFRYTCRCWSNVLPFFTPRKMWLASLRTRRELPQQPLVEKFWTFWKSELDFWSYIIIGYQIYLKKLMKILMKVTSGSCLFHVKAGFILWAKASDIH